MGAWRRLQRGGGSDGRTDHFTRYQPGETITVKFTEVVNHVGSFRIAFDDDGRAVSLEEKPEHPRSNQAVTGLYMFDAGVCDHAATLVPSARGELEITDLARRYMDAGVLHVEAMGRGFAWLDTGTHDSLLEAGQFIQSLEKRQGLKICCPEEIAWRAGWIDDTRLVALAERSRASGYGEYLLGILRERVY